MSVISSNSLFHLTSSVNSLISILKNNFYPRYSFESYNFSNAHRTTSLQGGFPMVCFCDLPLSQIKRHLRIYGQYGLGMKKEWGKVKGLNPILYISPDSILASSLDRLYSYMASQRNMALDDVNSVLNMLRYVKPYDNIFVHRQHRYPKYRFYNEREWRYIIPYLSGVNSPPPVLSKAYCLNPIELARNNVILENYPLTFTPDDIKYVIIKDESEITNMINSLREIKVHYSQNVIDILASKIITSKQIKEDF